MKEVLDFLILRQPLQSHQSGMGFVTVLKSAEISLRRGLRCFFFPLLCRQKEFSCDCFPRGCMHGPCVSGFSHLS